MEPLRVQTPTQPLDTTSSRGRGVDLNNPWWGGVGDGVRSRDTKKVRDLRISEPKIDPVVDTDTLSHRIRSKGN